jgi:hypothetical protein
VAQRMRFCPWLATALAVGTSGTLNFPQQGEVAPTTRPIKIALNYARADVVALALGGSVFDIRPRVPEEALARDSLASMLPEGIDSVTALNADNTLMVRGTAEGIRELKEILRTVDVQPQRVRLVAVASVTIIDELGKSHHVSLTADGSSIGGHEISMKTTRTLGPPLPHETQVRTVASDLRIRGELNRDQTVALGAAWAVGFGPLKPGAMQDFPARYEFAMKGSRKAVSLACSDGHRKKSAP